MDNHRNFCYSTVAVAPSPANSGTSLTVQTGDGALFPTTPFNATVWPAGVSPRSTNAEIVRVTDVTGDVFTFTRAQESTSAINVAINYQIIAGITAKTLTDVEDVANSAFSRSQVLGMSNLGNSAGTTGVVSNSSIRFLLAGGNNVTLSQSINGDAATITISAFNQSVQPIGSVTLGASNLGNTAGTSGTISGSNVQFLLAGGNNVTLSQSINGASATITISAFTQSVQPLGSQTAGISNLGNTSGTSGIASGSNVQVILAGGNNITLSQSVNGASVTITVSAFTQSVQPVGSDTLGISNLGNTSGTSGTVNGSNVLLILAGGNNITLSQSVNGSSATVTISAFTQSAESQSAGISNLGNTSGTSGIGSGAQVRFLLAGGNNITLSQSVNGASVTVTISAFTQSVQPIGSVTIGASNLGNTAGTSGVASGSSVQFVLAGGNNVTLSQSVNGASATITISAFNQSVQPVGSQSIGISNLGNTAGTSGIGSGSAVLFYLAGGNNVTLSQSVNGASATVTISAFNQSVQPVGSATLGISNLGNTAGTSGTVNGSSVMLVLAGGNNITLSQSINGSTATISISAFNQTVGSQSVGISNLGNTAGTSGIGSGAQVQFLLAGGNNVTLSQSVNGASVTVSINGVASGTGTHTFGMSNLGNTSGTSGTITGTNLQMIFAGGNNITLSQSINGSSATISISAPAQLGEYCPIDASSMITNSTLGQNTIYFTPFDFPYAISVSRLNLFLSVATTLQASNSTNSAGYTISAAMYSRAASATDRLASFWSASAFMRMSNSSNTAVKVTIPFGISDASNVSTTSNTNIASSNISTYLVNSVGGFRILPLPISSLMSPGHYWLAIANSSTSSNAIGVLNCSVMQQTVGNVIAFEPFGTSSVASNASVAGISAGVGTYSATSGAFPSTIALSVTDIKAALSATYPVFNFSVNLASTNIL
jgi:hypothetical protein